MDAAWRRAYIKQQAALKKQVEGQTSKGTGSSKPSTKRKQQEKSVHFPKKLKTVPELVVGLEAETRKTAITLGHGKGKGFMKGPTPVAEKPLVLLREDSKYALEKLSSIITSNGYKDLSNYAIEAMGKIGLFCIAQVTCLSSSLFLSFSLPCFNFVLLLGNVDDEGVDGPLPEP